MSKFVCDYTDQYGDKRTIHKTRHGLAKKRPRSTPIIAMSNACAILLGRNIKNARQRTGMTMKQLGDSAGFIDVQVKNRIWSIENPTDGRGGIRLGSLYAIACALNVHPADLLPTTDEVLALAGVKIARPAPTFLMKEDDDGKTRTD